MKQITQKIKDGKLKVVEVPPPVIGEGMVLVKNHFSLISAGTEISTVKAARKSLIGKARSRPEQVKQVLDVVMSQGPVQAYRAVMKKLDSLSPLGYSTAGVVLEVGPEVEGFTPGDKVACAGNTASHAEIIAVPGNLCVKLSGDADLKKAAYNTLGAIALQGIRQADLRLGETCAVIGLGLLGQITALLLRAGGIRVVGIDVSEDVVKVASEHSVDEAFRRDEPGLAEKVDDLTSGVGCDAVIITAATESLDPVNFAGRLARKKGKVVIVGAVPTGFDRDPDFYRKELDLRMSCSYGPGRYDPVYEEKGVDYPPAYVRWTEKRNMEAFQELIHTGMVAIDFLTTGVFDLHEAPEAYELILKNKEPSLGILIKYDIETEAEPTRIALRPPDPEARITLGMVGAGSYAMGYLLPNLAKMSDVDLKGVMAASGTSSRSAAEKFGFEFCTSEAEEIFGSNEINTLFVATRHDSHARYVVSGLEAGKNVFVEKPLCLTEEELEEIRDKYYSSAAKAGARLMVGFNRRFSPLTEKLMGNIGPAPLAMTFRINAGAIPADSWIQDKEIGGGRIIGEACHFIDQLTFINGSLPERVYATAMRDPQGLGDTVLIDLTFRNGSIGSIAYMANGSRALPKEYLEVYSSGMTVVLDDFRTLTVYGKKKALKKRLPSQDKGQKKMVSTFIASIKEGGPSPIPFEEIYHVTLATLKAVESVKTGRPVSL